MSDIRLPTPEQREASRLYAERLASTLREQGYPARVVELLGSAWEVRVKVEMVGFAEEGGSAEHLALLLAYLLAGRMIEEVGEGRYRQARRVAW